MIKKTLLDVAMLRKSIFDQSSTNSLANALSESIVLKNKKHRFLRLLQLASESDYSLINLLLSTEMLFSREEFFQNLKLVGNFNKSYPLIEHFLLQGYEEAFEILDSVISCPQTDFFVRDSAAVWQATYRAHGSWQKYVDTPIYNYSTRSQQKRSSRRDKFRIAFLSSKFTKNALSSQNVYESLIFGSDTKNFEISLLSLKNYGDDCGYVNLPGVCFIDLSKLPVAQQANQISNSNFDFIVDLSGSKTLLSKVTTGKTVSLMGGMTFLGGIYDLSIAPKFAFGPTSNEITRWVEMRNATVIPPPKLMSFPMRMSRISGTRTGITFGVFSRLSKWSPEFFILLREILERVRNSSIVCSFIQANPIAEIYLKEKFFQYEIDPSRVTMINRTSISDHYKKYQSCDFILDSVPQGGGLSVIDAFYLGVPIVALNDGVHWRNSGPSIINSLGFGELVAESREQYVDIVEKYSQDDTYLEDFRRRSRDVLLGSALMNAKLFSSNFYRGLIACEE